MSANFTEGTPDCYICDHPFSHRHRIKPGRWGGTYDRDNVVYLCPNHHAAIHFVMAWYYRPGVPMGGDDRLLCYIADREFWSFWLEDVKPIVIDRLIKEGRRVPSPSEKARLSREAPR